MAAERVYRTREQARQARLAEIRRQRAALQIEYERLMREDFADDDRNRRAA